jgi:hypothetical protein
MLLIYWVKGIGMSIYSHRILMTMTPSSMIEMKKSSLTCALVCSSLPQLEKRELEVLIRLECYFGMFPASRTERR